MRLEQPLHLALREIDLSRHLADRKQMFEIALHQNNGFAQLGRDRGPDWFVSVGKLAFPAGAQSFVKNIATNRVGDVDALLQAQNFQGQIASRTAATTGQSIAVNHEQVFVHPGVGEGLPESRDMFVVNSGLPVLQKAGKPEDKSACVEAAEGDALLRLCPKPAAQLRLIEAFDAPAGVDDQQIEIVRRFRYRNEVTDGNAIARHHG